MGRAGNPNLELLERAVVRLGPLVGEMVFLGGCATALLFTDPAAPPVRMTQDVDVITEVSSLGDYHRLSERLRERGFVEALYGHLPGDVASQERVPLVLARIRAIAES